MFEWEEQIWDSDKSLKKALGTVFKSTRYCKSNLTVQRLGLLNYKIISICAVKD